MAIGAVIRRVLGARLARHVGRWYRAIFVDLTKEAAALATVIPRNAHLLDIGGGDGEPLNHLLALRPDLRITTLDPGPNVGQWIEERFNARVTRMARTSLEEYLARGRPDPDAVLIADVLHHIPKANRAGFLSTLRVLLERVPQIRIIVKDVEPGFWRARLGYWSDRYITRDLGVTPISREHLTRLFEEAFGPLRRENTNLFEADRPNYAIAFFR
jgi:cyclopropane fatty-acyl-phospholipid synthase-like methyltransferase